ncbi:MAG: DNA-directed RNA polymerase subunit P [archaeon]|nr:DNA-directed RNA polymerase subunit P [archaeon]
MNCSKAVKEENVRTRVRCPYCGYKMLYKSRRIPAKVKAR